MQKVLIKAVLEDDDASFSCDGGIQKDAEQTFQSMKNACNQTAEVLDKVQLLEDGIDYMTGQIYEK